MTDTNTTPKKSNTKLFVIIALILAAVYLDYSKFHYVLGTDVKVTDSTNVVTPIVDTLAKVAAVVDTTKRDTTKK